MDVRKAISQRRSIRRYKDIPVGDEDLKILLEAARLAPSGSNTCCGRYIAVRSREMRERLAEVCHNQKWMAQAPLHIVCIADMSVRLPAEGLEVDELSPMHEVKQSIRDVAIAAEHIVLQAEELGLATCWVAWFNQKEIRPAVELPPDKYVVCVITIGYADESPGARRRPAMEDIIHYEKW